jgi:zinc protease
MKMTNLRRTLVLCLLVPGWLACMTGRPDFDLVGEIPDRPIVDAQQLQRFELSNGLTVLLLEDHRFPKISMGLSTRRGGATEPLSEAGVSSLMAEVMSNGAGERDSLALAEAVDGLGASLGVMPGWDSVTVYVSGLSRDKTELLAIFRDVVRAPRFEEHEIQRARSEQLAVIGRQQDDPAALVRLHFTDAMFPDHRYGISMMGTAESVSTLKGKHLKACYDRLFNARSGVLYVSGDFDAVQLRQDLETAFGDWREGQVASAVAAPPAVFPEEQRIVVVDRPELVQSRIMLGHEGMSRSDDRRVVNGIMNGILGGNGFSSRLMRKIRSDEGLTYGVYSGVAMRRQPGAFQVSTFTRVSETRRVVDLILEGIRGMQDTPPDEEAVGKAKSFDIGRFALGLETTRAVMSSLGDLEVHDLPKDSLDTYRQRVRVLTEADVAAEAQRFLHPDRMVIVVVGPALKLVPQLESLGNVEVIAP